jgi:NO-binding membrane sensor protein with MHYT domain
MRILFNIVFIPLTACVVAIGLGSIAAMVLVGMYRNEITAPLGLTVVYAGAGIVVAVWQGMVSLLKWCTRQKKVEDLGVLNVKRN